MPEHHGEKAISSALGMKIRINSSVLGKHYASTAFRICESLIMERQNTISRMEIRPGLLTWKAKSFPVCDAASLVGHSELKQLLFSSSY